MEELKDILLRLGLLREEDIVKAMELYEAEGGKRSIASILESLYLTDEQKMAALSMRYGLPVITEADLPESMPIEKISLAFLRENVVLPLWIREDVLHVAVADPEITEATDNLRATFGHGLAVHLAPASVILGRLDMLESSRDAVMQRALEGAVEEEMVSEAMGDVKHLKDLAEDRGIVQLANLIIENAVKDRASDIHIEPSEKSVRVRYRIDGMLHDKEALPLGTQAALTSRLKLLAGMDIAERRLPQDGRIRSRFGEREIDIRVSTLPSIHGESLVLRLLDKEASFITLEELGLPDGLYQIYSALISFPNGMILITGPTGSGKTTTLYGSLERINSPEKKIITIEEPVEYMLKGVVQIPVRPKIGLTFANGLRHIVRQDPDVIMVGEIRDIETASIAIHAALTGHLLFSTLHTNDAASAVTRLVDMGVENYLVSSTLMGVVAQRLIRKICSNCKLEYELPDDAVKLMGGAETTAWRGEGCPECMGTGYRGRVGIYEVMIVDDEIRDLIAANASAGKIKAAAVNNGMRTLRDDGIDKVRKGVTTIDEVLRVTQEAV